MKHSHLIHHAAKLLRSDFGCIVVLIEPQLAGDEFPDVIGWNRLGTSFVMECKTTRGDFNEEWRRQERKAFRREPDLGMGDKRYYVTPPGVLDQDKVGATRWGLVEMHGTTPKLVLDCQRFNPHRHAETRLLSRALHKYVGKPIPEGYVEQLDFTW